jgi:predicted nucleotidyltransferase
MSSFIEQIRELRKKKGVPLRTVAAFLDIDQAILSKVEHGKRKATKEHVLKMAEFYGIDKDHLLVSWLSDKIAFELPEYDMALKVLQVAEEKVAYKALIKTDRITLIGQMVQTIKQFSNIHKVWIFGSFARQDDRPGSDIDLAVKTDDDFSYFDLAEVQYHLEQKLQRKIDIGFMDSFKPYILNKIKSDLQLIYESPKK